MKRIKAMFNARGTKCYDVAVAPFIVIFGVMGLVAVAAVGLLVWLAVKLIKKAGAKNADNK